MRHRLASLHAPILLAVLALQALPATAQNVSYSGRMGDRALLVIDGAPRTLALGQEAQGVKLLMLDGENATVMIRNQRLSLRMGAQPASVGALPAAAEASAPARDSGQRIVLGAGSDGHFQVNGSIGGKPVRFLVDTGATAVSMSQQEADRLGLNWRAGKRVAMQTANGVTPAWRLSIDRVRIGEVELHQVDAVVGAQDMPVVLLGNSFLSRFRMQRDGEQMVLERRY
ncbi:MAG: hypothetical protein RLZZ524_1977 [Pseudomonadota bacterium]